MVNVYSWSDYVLDYILFFKRSPSVSTYLSGLFSKCSFNRIFCAFNGTLMSSPSRLFIHVLPQFGIKLIITGIDAGCDVTRSDVKRSYRVLVQQKTWGDRNTRTEAPETSTWAPACWWSSGGGTARTPAGRAAHPGTRFVFPPLLWVKAAPRCWLKAGAKGEEERVDVWEWGGMFGSVTGLIPVQSLLPCGRSGYCFSSS